MENNSEWKLKKEKVLDNNKKQAILEKQKLQAKSEANIYLNMCTQLAEELIDLRNKYDQLCNEKQN